MPYRYRMLGLLFLLSMITYLDRVCISVLGVRMQEDLGLTPKMWGWVVGLFTLSYALFEIPTGAWGDKYGPRQTVTRIVLWWSAFTMITGAVANYYVLLVVRFLFGAGEAGAYPNIAVSISRWFPPVERAKASGISWMAARLGGAVAPMLTIWIAAQYGWRTAFYLYGALGAVWCLLWWSYFRDNPREKAGISAEELALIGTPKVAEAHHGLPWGQVLKSRNFITLLLMYHTYCWGSYFYLSWLSTYLQKGRGFTESEMTIWATLPFLVGAAGNFFGGWLSDRLVKSKGLKIGRCAIGATGLALSGICMISATQVADRQACALLLAMGYCCMDCMLPVSWAICMDIGRKYSGAVSGSMNMAGQLGSFLSSVLFGYLVGWMGGDYNKALLPLASMLLLSAYLYTRINPNELLVPERAPAPEPEPVAA
ncbi:MAG: MFS transporter [Acidobacteriota bacterium]